MSLQPPPPPAPRAPPPLGGMSGPAFPPAMPPIPGAAPMAAGRPPGAPGPAPMPPPAPGSAAPPAPGAAQAGQPGQPVEGELAPLGPTLGFWQQAWVQDYLPILTSLMVHALIVILGLVFLKVVYVDNGKKVVQEEQTIIPDATLAENSTPGGVPNVGTGGDAFKQAMQDVQPDGGTADGVSSKAAPTVDVQPAGGGSGEAESANLIGVGMTAMGRGKGSGSGSGNGTGSGSGDGGGPLAMFGAPGGGAMGPKGPVFGNGGNARHITFVCDASGSMISKFASLKLELQKTIQGLKLNQTFNIIFFQDGKSLNFDNNGLVQATEANKRRAYKFLEDVTTSSTSDPLPGLTVAFSQKPQLVYLLTDGDFPNNDAVRAKVKEMNKDGKIKINTIAFVDPAKDTETDFIKLLSDIANQNGGKYSYINENDLNN